MPLGASRKTRFESNLDDESKTTQKALKVHSRKDHFHRANEHYKVLVCSESRGVKYDTHFNEKKERSLKQVQNGSNKCSYFYQGSIL